MHVELNTVYYLLSTLAQTYAALMALVGAISVFRYQTASNLQESAWRRIEKNLQTVGCHFEPYSPTETILFWLDSLRKEKKLWEQVESKFPVDFGKVLTEEPWLVMYSEWRKRMRKALRLFFVYHMAFIITCIVFLVFSQPLVRKPEWAFFGLGIVLALSCFLIYRVYRSVISQSEGKRDHKVSSSQ
jgi:hypothetical protein